MAPLPVNNTARFWVDYRANGRAHTLMARYNGSAEPDVSFVEGLDDWLIACNGLMPTDWQFIGWRYAVQGSDISVPYAGVPTTFAGIRTPAAYEAPAFISFIGRSPGGRRVRLYLLGAGFDPAEAGGQASDYRIYATENAAVDGAIDALIAWDPVAVDQQGANWKSYVNAGFNAYWQRTVRT